MHHAKYFMLFHHHHPKVLSCFIIILKCYLFFRKQAVEENWKQKTAEEADLIISDDDEEEEVYQGRKKTTSDTKSQISQTRFELQQSLRIPLTQTGYGGAYPTMSGSLIKDMFVKKEEKAVEVLEKNLKYTKNLLRGKKNNNVKKDRFKGFKKRQKKGK